MKWLFILLTLLFFNCNDYREKKVSEVIVIQLDSNFNIINNSAVANNINIVNKDTLKPKCIITAKKILMSNGWDSFFTIKMHIEIIK